MSRAGKRWTVAAVLVGLGVFAYFSNVWFYEKFVPWAVQAMWGRALEQQSTPESRQLLADVRRFRTESASMEPKAAVDVWMRLYERARAVQFNKVQDYDVDMTEKFGMASVLAGTTHASV